MSGSENWRTEVDAGDYFGHRQKKLNIADRRPVIRRASDLVGPGIASTAIRLTNFNDLLATYDGFFSSAAGAAVAPNATDQFSGTVVSDSTLGGVQTFTSLTTGLTYTRVFSRSPLDPSALFWGDWRDDDPSLVDGRLTAAEGRLTAGESGAAVLDTRLDSAEGRLTTLESHETPLYSGLLNFFMTGVATGGTASGTVTFDPGVFNTAPAPWAIKAGFASGSGFVLVTACDTVTLTSFRVVLTNIGPGLATFADLPVRWFAQEVGFG